MGQVGDPTKRCHFPFGTDDHQFHVAAVLGDEQVTGAFFDSDVVHPGERLPVPTAVPYQLMSLVAKVDGVDPVVGFGSEPNPAVVVPDSLRAGCHVCLGHLFLGRDGGACGIGHLPPGNEGFGDDHGLEPPTGQVRVGVGGEPVQHSALAVLGQVEHPLLGVDGHRLVGKEPHGVAGDRLALPGWIALPHPAPGRWEESLLAGKPRAPRRGPAGTVGVAAGQDREGVEDLAVGVEVH